MHQFSSFVVDSLRLLRWLGSALGLALVVSGCASPWGCVPGSEAACACLGGPTGVQTCNAAGTYEPCVCPSAGAVSAPAPLSSVPTPTPTPMPVPTPGRERERTGPGHSMTTEEMLEILNAPSDSEAALVTRESPSRDEVASELRRFADPVAACGTGGHGVANVRIVVEGSTGHVREASVLGEFAGTPVGACVARAVRGASFEPFTNPTFTVSYPYRL